MFKSTSIALFCAGLLALPSAHAETYQYDINTSIIDYNAYSFSVTNDFTYYFQPVDDSLGPRNLAPFLNKSSRVSFGYDYTHFPGSSNEDRDEIYNPSLSLVWAFDNDVVIGGGTSVDWTNYTASSGLTTRNYYSNHLRFGYFVNDNTYLETRYYNEYDNKGEYFQEVNIGAFHVMQLDNGQHLSLRGFYAGFNNDDDEYDGSQLYMETEYFPTTNVSVYAGINLVKFEEADSRQIVSAGMNYYFTPTFNAGVNVATKKYGSKHYTQQSLHLSKRF